MNAQRTALFGIASIVPLLVILLVGVIIWISLTFNDSGPTGIISLRNFLVAFRDPFTVTAISNTVYFTIVTLLVAFFFGIPIAWLSERTDIGGRHVI